MNDEPKGQEPKSNYFKVKNEWWDALIGYRIPGEAAQCLRLIIRQTYGYKKKKANISDRYFCKMTGLSRWSVVRANKWLLNHNITGCNKAASSHTTYWFNKYYNTWKPAAKKQPDAITHPGRMPKSSQNRMPKSSQVNTKDNFKEKGNPQKGGFGEPPNYKNYKPSDGFDISILVTAENILKTSGEQQFNNFCQLHKIPDSDIRMIRERQ